MLTEFNPLDKFFEREWAKILPKVVGHGNGIVGDIRPYIKKILKKATIMENKEWREGRRCEICGSAKAPNQTTMCRDCLETQ